MNKEFYFKIPDAGKVRPIVVFWGAIFGDRGVRLSVEIFPLRFRPDLEHIEWLCSTHEWLRPYFPFWDLGW